MAAVCLRCEQFLGQFYHERMEERVCLIFCVFNEIKVAESLKMRQKCFEEFTLPRTQYYISGTKHSVKPVKSSKTCLKQIVHPPLLMTRTSKILKKRLENLVIRDIAADLNICYGST